MMGYSKIHIISGNRLPEHACILAPVNLLLAHVSAQRGQGRASPAETLVADYLARAARYLPCSEQAFASEEALFLSLEKRAGRTRPVLILFDRLGQALSSEQFAVRLRTLRDAGTQTAILAIGPADGWSAEARGRANLLISFGPITLPHELARVVLAEQTYRALTILAGHPYHSGH
jgi:23S rRNA (pseudouridine1915-N3)-methyltransferase